MFIVIIVIVITGHIVTSAGIRLPGEIAYGIPFTSIKSGLAAIAGKTTTTTNNN